MRKPSGKSRRQSRISFSTKAKDDLESLAAFTFERFSGAQEQKYRDSLSRVLELLVAFPKMGAEQEHIAPGLRRHVHASHSIYYSEQENGLFVERILGAGQDPLLEFGNQR